MKKTILLTAIFVLVLLTAACQPAIDEKKSDFCQDLGDFAQAQVQFRQINPTSTVDDLEEAALALERSWENLKDSAGDLAEVQLRSLEDALQNLRRDIEDVPDDAENLAEAELMIKQDVLSTMAETVQIFNTTCTYGQDQ